MEPYWLAVIIDPVLIANGLAESAQLVLCRFCS
jgi:hypothetical protein